MAPPNSSTNTSISRTGRRRAVIRASTWRRDRRRQRPAMVRDSDKGGLRFGIGVAGQMAREGEEDVVERRRGDGEAHDVAAARVELVEHGTDVPGAAVGGHAERQRGAV